jgi:hypothetical protein
MGIVYCEGRSEFTYTEDCKEMKKVSVGFFKTRISFLPSYPQRHNLSSM